MDDILKDMDLEISDVNRRAVRILGYNRMEISEENIGAVKSADSSIQRVLGKMTPAAVIQMIREGKNPLSMDMQELETYLDNRERSPQEDMEKYSEYLYKLERNHSVTEQERDAYIGIYRLFRQLEKDRRGGNRYIDKPGDRTHREKSAYRYEEQQKARHGQKDRR